MNGIASILPTLGPHLPQYIAKRIRRLAMLIGVGLVVSARLQVGRHVHVFVRKEGVDPILDPVGTGVGLVNRHVARKHEVVFDPHLIAGAAVADLMELAD